MKMPWPFRDQTQEMGYTEREVERLAGRSYTSRDFIERLDRERRADGEIPWEMHRDAERYHDEVRFELRQKERRLEEAEESARWESEMARQAAEARAMEEAEAQYAEQFETW